MLDYPGEHASISIHLVVRFTPCRLRTGLAAAPQEQVTSAAAILSLALGIGACLAAFQLVNALLLRPLPIAGPDRLYALSRQKFPADGPPTTRDNWQPPLLQNIRDAVAKQAALLAISEAERAEITFRSDQEMERAQVAVRFGQHV